MSSPSKTAVLIATEVALRSAIEQLSSADRIALDVESNGLFKFKATLCTMQLAGRIAGSDPDAAPSVFIVDTIATPLASLGKLLGPGGPRKIIHDIAFDARILAECGLELGNVYDTSIAARMLGRTATGLASLLQSELGISVDKKLQHHDWTERPIREVHVRYLADDVNHLEALADKLMAEVDARGPIAGPHTASAIEEETLYRLAQAAASLTHVDPRPPWIRLKGIDRAPTNVLPILRYLAELRENKARQLDVPPYKVMGPDVLFAIAHARPKTMDELLQIKGAASGPRARAIANTILEAVAKGVDEGFDAIPADERAMLERPRLPPHIAKARRQREQRLTGWRKREAKSRAVDEQVILPGHCLQDLADLDDADEAITLEHLAAIAGIGAFRIESDGAALIEVLKQPPPPPPPPPTPAPDPPDA